jgi:hypothetical protein
MQGAKINKKRFTSVSQLRIRYVGRGQHRHLEVRRQRSGPCAWDNALAHQPWANGPCGTQLLACTRFGVGPSTRRPSSYA